MACEDEDGALGPCMKTQAELLFEHLLDKQLSTNARFEQVEFQGATKDIFTPYHSTGGVASRADFIAQQANERTSSSVGNHQSAEERRKSKRRRYGADPAATQRIEDGKQIEQQRIEHPQRIFGRHEKELEASLLRGNGRLNAIAHLSVEGIPSRKPLLELSEMCKGTTPEDRARSTITSEAPRTVSEVFSSPAPCVLDMSTYLDTQRDTCLTDKMTSASEAATAATAAAAAADAPLQVPKEAILSNRLTLEELKKWRDGKFSNYSAGEPTNGLYIKNLAADVTEDELVGIFVRYQKPGENILYKLMQSGRMKGQAFVRFKDEEVSKEALELVNGYMLHGKPMIIQYAKGANKSNMV